MNAALQLDFFRSEEECWQLSLEKRQEDLEKRMTSSDNKLERQRKCQFAKIGENTKSIDDLKRRVEFIERGLCRSDNK